MDAAPARKKREAERQITSDNYDQDETRDGEEGGGDSGTFQRAEDSVLAQRRIVKARRPGAASMRPTQLASDAAPKASPFAGFSLIQPAQPGSTPAGAAPPSKEVDGLGKEAGGAGAGGEPKATDSGKPPDEEPEQAEDDGKPQAAEADVTEAPESDNEDVTSVPRKAAAGEGDGDGNKEPEAAGGEGAKAPEQEKGPLAGAGQPSSGGKRPRAEASSDLGKAEGDGGEGGEGEGTGEWDGFAKLSSATNAFSTPFGSSFPGSNATPFSFGTSAFAASSGGLATPTVSPMAQSAFPSLSSVFGAANGGGTRLQLFGSGGGDTDETGPDGGGPALTNTTPVVTLAAVDVVTGEEKEAVVFAHDATLYEFEDAKWKERGKGELRLNVPEEDGRRARLVMRARGNLRLLLNANLFPDMKVAPMDAKGLTFACVNSVEEAPADEKKASTSAPSDALKKPSLTTVALKFKDPEHSTKLRELIQEHKQQGVAASAGEAGGAAEQRVEAKKDGAEAEEDGGEAKTKGGEAEEVGEGGGTEK